MAVVTRVLSIGYVQTIAQNEIVALPTRRCLLFTDAAGPTLFQSNTVGFTVSVALTLVNGSCEVGGGFIRCTSAGPININLTALS